MPWGQGSSTSCPSSPPGSGVQTGRHENLQPSQVHAEDRFVSRLFGGDEHPAPCDAEPAEPSPGQKKSRVPGVPEPQRVRGASDVRSPRPRPGLLSFRSFFAEALPLRQCFDHPQGRRRNTGSAEASAGVWYLLASRRLPLSFSRKPGQSPGKGSAPSPGTAFSKHRQCTSALEAKPTITSSHCLALLASSPSLSFFPFAGLDASALLGSHAAASRPEAQGLPLEVLGKMEES